MKKRRIQLNLILLVLITLLVFSGCSVKAPGKTVDTISLSGEPGSASSTAVDSETGTKQQTTEASTAGATLSPGETNNTTGATTQPATTASDSVTVKVTCAEAVEYIKQHNIKGYESVVPANGIILEQQGIKLQENDSVMSVLIRTLNANGIAYKVDNGIYVQTIKGLTAKSKDFGQQSGWLYSVNDITPPNIGAASYTVYDSNHPEKQPVLKPGDVIEFKFVTKQTYF
jgi:hypothetical protein